MKTSIKIFLLIISVTLLVTAISLFTSESQTTTASTVGNWYKDPAAIRAFVNSVYGYTLIPTAYHGAGALNYDSATALKVCQLAGFDSVDSYSCTHDPRCGYSSCNDNVLAKWNTNTKKFDIVNACTLGNKWIATLVCKNTAPICTTHFSKKCVGNSIYWFDSCNAQEDVYQTCTANQICQDAKCVDVACSTNSQCGTNGYVGELFCEGNNVYRNYKTYTCNNPGTINSSCSNSTTAKLQQTCTTNQTCSNGACVNLPIVCSTNSQCGTNGYVGGPYCIGNSVYKNYKEYICLKPGTINSSCTDSVSIKLFNNCSINQTCNLGICVDQPITCSTNSQCGTNGYVGDAFCSGGDVYKAYRTYVCNNPGTTSSSCLSTITDKLVTNCGSNQTCSNGACVDQEIACSTNSQCGTNGYVGDAFCSGGDVYKSYRTYTCNNPGTVNSTCSSATTDKLVTNCGSNQTCSNGACVDQEIACSTNSQCGTNGYVGDAFCSGGDVYKLYRIYTCNNPGTVNSTCLSATTDKLVTNCSANQTCSNGACVSNCIIHSYKQCFGNYLYWYDSCGTREDIAEYCSNGCSGNACISSYNINVQTNSPTNITNNQATLNGNVYGSNSFSGNVWFQWGTSTSYGNETSHQSFYNLGNFNQIINLNYGSNTTYHYRAVAQAFNGNIVYGQNMTFTTGSTTGSLNISKTARNLSSGSSGFSTTVYANPSDVIMFMITIQPNSNQEISNIYVRDTLPANLIYKGNLVVSGSNNYSGDINYGMNFGTITGNQIITITYQTQVAGAANFAYGTTTLNNSVSVTGSNLINNPTSNASVVVSRTAIQGISTISTGLTNNFWTDSFLLPLLIALVGMWMLKTGMFGGIEKWIDAFKQKGKNYKAEKELNSKISQIRELEKLKN